MIQLCKVHHCSILSLLTLVRINFSNKLDIFPPLFFALNREENTVYKYTKKMYGGIYSKIETLSQSSTLTIQKYWNRHGTSLFKNRATWTKGISIIVYRNRGMQNQYLQHVRIYFHRWKNTEKLGEGNWCKMQNNIAYGTTRWLSDRRFARNRELLTVVVASMFLPRCIRKPLSKNSVDH